MHRQILEEIQSQKKRSVLLILTGPTGAGKDTLINKLILERPNVAKIITTTSRQKRDTESEGNPYHFVTREAFEQMIGEGAFYEWVEFRSDFYGTQKKTIEEALFDGRDVIWKIEAKGVKNIKQKIKDMVPRSVFIYLTAPSVHTLHERVIQDEGKNILHRWSEPLVKWEMEQYDDCDYLVVNEDGYLNEAVRRVIDIIDAKRSEIIREIPPLTMTGS